MGQKQKMAVKAPHPSPLPMQRPRTSWTLVKGEREPSGIVDEPVLLRQVGVVNPIAERMNNISELDRFPLLGERVRGRGLCLCLLQPLNDKPSDRFRLIDI